MKIIKIGMLILLSAFLLLLLVFSYLYFNGLSGMTQTSTPKAGQLKVACIGDTAAILFFHVTDVICSCDAQDRLP